jgi:ATP-dependent RNA helicase DDX51/DBP6
MSRFYAQYVPPLPGGSGAVAAVAPAAAKLEKRKREDHHATPAKKQKSEERAHIGSRGSRADGTAEKLTLASGAAIIEKYRVTDGSKSEGRWATAKSTNKQESHAAVTGEDLSKKIEGTTGRQQRDKGKHSKKRKVESATTQEHPDKEDTERDLRHAGILSKFDKAQEHGQWSEKNEPLPEGPPIELHGLEPLPQPEQPEVAVQKPSYSTLPAWQENPVLVSPVQKESFDSFALPSKLLSNLKQHGFTETLPIQATLLPLLLDGPGNYDGDVCVSAATGSGKTLSYVAPVVADLAAYPRTRLRAVIVVPTRELVKQIQGFCELCASGTSLKCAVALGSKALVDEQESLVYARQIYDPRSYSREQQSQVNWAKFSLCDAVKHMKTNHLVDNNYITRYESKVDILITTPGRLVDHLRSTPGFNLDHVKWLIVDEADRLLNESYQEWLSVVKPALESRAAMEESDALLENMGMTPPRRKVTKLLLSATMTGDLSRLNALGLWNPKLVVLESDRQDSAEADILVDPAPTRNDSFSLPPSLQETVIPIADGSEKPLYLLKLLSSHIETVSGDASHSSSSISERLDPREISHSTVDNASNSKPRVLVFTRSTASAERLSRLLILLDPTLKQRLGTLTRSTASSASSRRALASFRASRTVVLVVTDRASRGLDVPGLEHVVSYDVPNSALTYIHRVGRTARANSYGHAWTFVEHREAAWFWREIGGRSSKTAPSIPGSSHAIVQRTSKVMKTTLSPDERMQARYAEALTWLGEEATR